MLSLVGKVFRKIRYSRSIQILLVSIFLAIFSVIVLHLIVEKSKNKGEVQNNILLSLCTSFIGGGIVVLIGVTNIRDHIDVMRQETDLLELESFWKNDQIVNGKKTVQYNPTYTLLVISSEINLNADKKSFGESSTFEACHRICKTLEKIYNDRVNVNVVIVKNEDEIKLDILQKENLIILGQGSTSKVIRQLCDKLFVPYFQRGDHDVIEKISAINQGAMPSFSSSYTSIEEDFCVATRITNPGRLLILFNSNNYLGTLGGVKFLTDSERIEESNFLKLRLQIEKQNNHPEYNGGMSLILGVTKKENNNIVKINEKPNTYSALSQVNNLQGMSIKISQEFDAFPSGHIATRINEMDQKKG